MEQLSDTPAVQQTIEQVIKSLTPDEFGCVDDEEHRYIAKSSKIQDSENPELVTAILKYLNSKEVIFLKKSNLMSRLLKSFMTSKVEMNGSTVGQLVIEAMLTNGASSIRYLPSSINKAQTVNLLLEAAKKEKLIYISSDKRVAEGSLNATEMEIMFNKYHFSRYDIDYDSLFDVDFQKELIRASARNVEVVIEFSGCLSMDIWKTAVDASVNSLGYLYNAVHHSLITNEMMEYAYSTSLSDIGYAPKTLIPDEIKAAAIRRDYYVAEFWYKSGDNIPRWALNAIYDGFIASGSRELSELPVEAVTDELFDMIFALAESKGNGFLNFRFFNKNSAFKPELIKKVIKSHPLNILNINTDKLSSQLYLYALKLAQNDHAWIEKVVDENTSADKFYKKLVSHIPPRCICEEIVDLVLKCNFEAFIILYTKAEHGIDQYVRQVDVISGFLSQWFNKNDPTNELISVTRASASNVSQGYLTEVVVSDNRYLDFIDYFKQTFKMDTNDVKQLVKTLNSQMNYDFDVNSATELEFKDFLIAFFDGAIKFLTQKMGVEFLSRNSFCLFFEKAFKVRDINSLLQPDTQKVKLEFEMWVQTIMGIENKVYDSLNELIIDKPERFFKSLVNIDNVNLSYFKLFFAELLDQPLSINNQFKFKVTLKITNDDILYCNFMNLNGKYMLGSKSNCFDIIES